MTAAGSEESTARVLDVDVAQARPRFHPWRWVATALVLLFLARTAVFLVQTPNFQWDVVAEYITYPTVLQGLFVTIAITVACTVLSVVVGTPVALSRLSSVAALKLLGAGYVWLFRGLPALVQIVFWFNLAYLLPQISVGIPFGPVFHSWSTNAVISPFTAALLGLGLTDAAFTAEIIRAGILSVDPGQRDASKSLGLGPRKTFFRVVIPQAMRFIIPPMGSQLIGLAKTTSLVSVVATTDLLFSVEVIYSRTFEVVPLLLVACFWYLCLVSVLFVLQTYLERRFSRGRGSPTQTGGAARGRSRASTMGSLDFT